MKILCISDIHWEDSRVDVLDKLKQDIEEHSPKIVLFGGDVINDGGNKEEHVKEFNSILEHLEKLKIHSLVIKGNHDEYSDYESVIEHIESLEFSEEISNSVTNVCGIDIAGISYSYTSDIKKVRQIQEDFDESYDIVLAHAENKRRIWLFELDTDYIITGHYDKKLCMIKNRVFVSLSSYINQRYILDTEMNEMRYIQRPKFSSEIIEYSAKVKKDDNKLDWLKDEYRDSRSSGLNNILNQRYSDMIADLICFKNNYQSFDESEQKERVKELRKNGCSKTLIREYVKYFDFL